MRRAACLVAGAILGAFGVADGERGDADEGGQLLLFQASFFAGDPQPVTQGDLRGPAALIYASHPHKIRLPIQLVNREVGDAPGTKLYLRIRTRV